MRNVEPFQALLTVTTLLLLLMLYWYKTDNSYFHFVPIMKVSNITELSNFHSSSVLEESDVISDLPRFPCNNFTTNVRVQKKNIKKICTGYGSLWTNNIAFEACEVKGCVIERNLSKSNECEAILLQSNHLGRLTIPRLKDQTWILVSHESPFTFAEPARNKIWRRAFHWLVSYQKNSDIFFPWGQIIVKKTRENKNYDAIFDLKKRTAVWLASNCRTQSMREKYIRIMGKIIDIDIFGKCGNLACKNVIRKDDPNDVCRDQKSIQYKFYLSFENALCPDYITEKVFLFYKNERHIIPVIRGIPNAERFLPKNTFVDANGFDNATQLAHYLKELGNDRDRYIAMLKEKDRYTVESLETVFVKAMCSLCRKLHHNAFSERCIDTNHWRSQQYNACRTPDDLK